uniref:Rho-GAP domain-containing protein n=2 Tax=Mesocestoides corti TaxID=53468 RepID=A0A5K3F2C7_MESCO
MHEAPVGLPIVVNISTIGYCSPTYASQYRVGKSCLIHRFMGRGQYTEDHLSVISSSDYCGSIIAASQWIYWGSRTIQHDSKIYRLRIIEQCDFIDDHLFTPFGKDPYMDRCFSSHIHVETPKTAYICKDQVGNEWKYPHEILEPGDFAVDVFVIVLDITLTGDAALSQQRFLKRAVSEMRRKKLPFVFASSKHDCFASTENREFVKNLLRKASKSLKKVKCCRVETSARLNVNVLQAFLSAALLCSSTASEITGKYFPYSPPPDTHTSPAVEPFGRFRHSDRAGTLVSIYADANSSPIGRKKLRLLPRVLNRLSLTESLTYDLPVDGKSVPSNVTCCSIPVVVSSDSSRQTSLRQKNPRLSEVLPVNGACTSHVCYETINPDSNLPPHQLPSPSRPQIAHIIHQPMAPSSHLLRMTPDDPRPVDSPNPSPQSLFILFLSGPGASALKANLQAQCHRDRFHLADDACFRVWIFDAVDPHAVQISPSKWQPHHALKPSPSVVSAFTTPVNSAAAGPHFRRASAGSADCGVKCRGSGRHQHQQQQLRLSLWASDMGVAGLEGSECQPPKNVDAVVLRTTGDDLPANEYYDEVGGDFKLEVRKVFDLSKSLKVPLFYVHEKASSGLLAALIFYAKNTSTFKAIIDSDPSSSSLILLTEPCTVDLPLITELCCADTDEDDPQVSIASTHNHTTLSSVDMPAFVALPRVAVGLDYVWSLPSEREVTTQSPLVVFATIYQTLEIFSQFEPEAGEPLARIRFAALHFQTPQWPKFCGELASQLQSLVTAASENLRRRRADETEEDDDHLIIMLVALTSADSTRPRQLVNLLATQQGCLLWHPKIFGPRLRPINQDDHQLDPHDRKPSLAFLHVQSERDREWELYRQALNADMSSWLSSYSPDYTRTSSTTTTDGRCSRGDNCEVCRHQQQPQPELQHQQEETEPLPRQHYSPVLLPRYQLRDNGQEKHWVTHHHTHCCTTAVTRVDDGGGGDVDPDYVASRFQAPPTCHSDISHCALLGQSVDDMLSEQYADFVDLLGEATESYARVKRPHRPQGPNVSPSCSSSSLVSLTMSSLVTSYTSSSPDRQVPRRLQRSLFRSCSDTPPAATATDLSSSGRGGCFRNDSGIVMFSKAAAGSTFTPIPVALAPRNVAVGSSLSELVSDSFWPVTNPLDGGRHAPTSDDYEPVYEEPIQLDCQPYKCVTPDILKGPGGWRVAESATRANSCSSARAPPVSETRRRSSRNWLLSGGCFFSPTPPASASSVRTCDGTDPRCSPAPKLSAPSAISPTASPRLSSSLANSTAGTIRSKSGFRRPVPRLIDSRRKSQGHAYPTPTVCDEVSVSQTSLGRDDSSRHANLFAGLKSAFRRRGSLFRSTSKTRNRKSHAKH